MKREAKGKPKQSVLRNVERKAATTAAPAAAAAAAAIVADHVPTLLRRMLLG